MSKGCDKPASEGHKDLKMVPEIPEFADASGFKRVSGQSNPKRGNIGIISPFMVRYPGLARYDFSSLG